MGKLGDVKSEALNNTLANTPPQGKAETLGNTMGDVKGKPSTRWLTPHNWQRPRQTSTHYAMRGLRHWSKRWLKQYQMQRPRHRLTD